MAAACGASATPATPSTLHAYQACCNGNPCCCNLVGALPACLLHLMLNLACKLPCTLYHILDAADSAPSSTYQALKEAPASGKAQVQHSTPQGVRHGASSCKAVSTYIGVVMGFTLTILLSHQQYVTHICISTIQPYSHACVPRKDTPL